MCYVMNIYVAPIHFKQCHWANKDFEDFEDFKKTYKVKNSTLKSQTRRK